MIKDDDSDNYSSYGVSNEKSSYSFHLSKSDNELFNEDDNKPSLLTTARRVKLSETGECWQILENNKIVLQLKGTRFTHIEKTFLYSLDGMKFLISSYRSGLRSVSKIKEKMKELV